MRTRNPKNLRWVQIYDSLYGFIKLTSTEGAVINSPYFQRLRWIKQLGFATYIFAGAEHTRFAHAIGVLHSADQMVRAIGRDVPPERLYDPKARDAKTMFHKSVRMAAMLHDIGTFPFSHSIEGSYIKFGEELKTSGKLPGKQLPNNHEHLGSYIIKKTDFLGGITRILTEGGFDTASLSRFIKGDSPDMVANQILHSDLDADRMDYLLRDAHHTGIKYGHIDRDYILNHLTTFKTQGGGEALAVNENAMHAVEDFLISRFSWYSQIVRNSASAKFDILAADIAYSLLKSGLIYSFQELLDLAKNDPERFFGFNDLYFMGKIQDLYWSKKIKDPVLNEKMKMLIYRIPPKGLRLPEAEHGIFELDKSGGLSQKEIRIEKLKLKVAEIENLFRESGNGTEWIIADIPLKDVTFTKSQRSLNSQKVKRFLDRDPVKIIGKNGQPSLLVDRKNSLVAKLSGFSNFIPNIYVNSSAFDLLKRKKLI